MSEVEAPGIDVTPTIVMRRFLLPRTVIGRFVARRSVRSAILWALVFSAYVASKAIGYVNAYPTEIARLKAVAAFTNNVGIEVLLGSAKHIGTVNGFVAWNIVGITVIIGAIWAILLATKSMRGEEDSGRWEILLLGQTTARRAAGNVLAGLAAVLVVFYAIIAMAFSLIGKHPGLGFSTSASLFMALIVIGSIATFMLIGTLASQLMPTRSRAAGVAMAVLGVSFLLRAIADTTSATWLLTYTPLGWVEKARALDGSNFLWLLPTAVLILILAALTLYLAGRRDLGESIVADKEDVKPRTALLNSPLTIAIRLTRATSLVWLLAIGASSILYGLLTKTASQAFNQSANLSKSLGRLSHNTHATDANIFLGIVFFIQMILIMAYAASAINAMRKDEAEGYLDNLLVRPVGRLQWLSGRALLCLIVTALAGLVTTFGIWIGVASQGLDVSFSTLLGAGVNALVPAILTLGFGILSFGIKPRLTSIVAYGVLAWSFLITMLSSGINLSHWILDTSVLSQIKFAPSVSPNWHVDLIIVGLGALLAIIGAARFYYRDLENE